MWSKLRPAKAKRATISSHQRMSFLKRIIIVLYECRATGWCVWDLSGRTRLFGIGLWGGLGRLRSRRSRGGLRFWRGRLTLISAPTGSGKTLSGFFGLYRSVGAKGSCAASWRTSTEVLYVSPLKALGNDIQKNLEVPLGEILQLAGSADC